MSEIYHVGVRAKSDGNIGVDRACGLGYNRKVDRYLRRFPADHITTTLKLSARDSGKRQSRCGGRRRLLSSASRGSSRALSGLLRSEEDWRRLSGQDGHRSDAERRLRHQRLER